MLFFLICFHNICCSYLGGLVILLLDHVWALGRMRIVYHCCQEIHCNNSMQTEKDHSIPDHWILRTQ